MLFLTFFFAVVNSPHLWFLWWVLCRPYLDHPMTWWTCFITILQVDPGEVHPPLLPSEITELERDFWNRMIFGTLGRGGVTSVWLKSLGKKRRKEVFFWSGRPYKTRHQTPGNWLFPVKLDVFVCVNSKPTWESMGFYSLKPLKNRSYFNRPDDRWSWPSMGKRIPPVVQTVSSYLEDHPS